MNLELKAIRLDGDTQCRKSIDPKWVQEYAENMKGGQKYPNPVVFFDGKSYWLADGFHRLSAHKSNGALEIEVDVKEGTVREARLYAIRENNRHGKNMSPEEKRDNIVKILKDDEWGQWSNVKIAEIIGSSHVTVSRVRNSLEEEATEAEEGSETPEEGQDEKKVTYVNKHGQKAKMKTQNIGRSKKKKTEDKEKKAGDPYQMTKEQELSQKLKEAEFRLNETINENDRLRDAIAVGQYDATDIEKIDVEQTIKELRQQVDLLETENRALRESRDIYQNRAAEAQKLIKVLQSKLKKAGIQ